MILTVRIKASQSTKKNTAGPREAGRAKSLLRVMGLDREGAQGIRPKSPVPFLHHIPEESMERMGAGDILLLDATISLRSLVDSVFYALLACPACGKLELITQSQYSGTEAVICGHSDCSSHFRITQKRHFNFLPVN
jgi:hypothetical protein